MKEMRFGYKSILAFVASAIVCISFFVYVALLLHEYAVGVTDHAEERADFYTREQTYYIEAQCDALKREVTSIAADLAACNSAEAFAEGVMDARAFMGEDTRFLDLFYERDGTLFGRGGVVTAAYPELRDIAGTQGGAVLSRVFQFENRVMAVAACAPVVSEYADRVIAVFDRAAISLSAYALDVDGEPIDCVEKTEFTLLCKHDGRVVDRYDVSDAFAIGNEPVQEGVLQALFTDRDTLRSVSEAMVSGGVTSFSFRAGAEDYILSVGAFGAEDGHMALLCAYRVSRIYGEGFTIMQSISAALTGLAVVMAVMLAVVVIHASLSHRRRLRQETVVPHLRCSTQKHFERTAEEILKRHTESGFAFVSLQIGNYSYFVEHFGEEVVKRLCGGFADAIRHALFAEETFGYAEEGEFLLLLHFRDRAAFSERLNGIYLRASVGNELGDGTYQVAARFAVYEVEREERQSIRQMLDKLEMAKEASPMQNVSVSVSFYEDVIRRNYMRKAEIEGRMEQALQGNEFHLFYQPKYNLRKKTLDGSEVLVRWYDTALGKYHVPAEFLPVFEENGFIVKLDHFVFYKACENLANRVRERQICYPVSINVSRVTAIQADFVSYYARIKSKFGIRDRFITLEFTESFAYENYEFLHEIVDRLHGHGFLCSLDDFGTGYSSYNILKTIEMDEIKLDKFFLGKGLTSERDQTLLESVISMVRRLGMKVTQEGVETKEDLYRLEELGCDVIQGYYFAKPMKYSDYCAFIDQNFL